MDERDGGTSVMTAPTFPVASHSLHIEDVPARRATRSACLVFGCRAAAAVLGVVVAGTLTRHLGAAAFGELSVILTVAVIGSNLSDFGTTPLAVSGIAAEPHRRAELAAGLGALRVLAGSALGAVGAVVLLAVVRDERATVAVAAVMCTVPLAGLAGLVVLAHGRLRPEVGAGLALGQSALWLASVVALGRAEAPFGAYGLAFLGCSLAQLGGVWLTVVRHEPVAWSSWLPALRSLLRRGWPLGLAALFGTVYYRFDSVLVFRWSGPVQAGFYAAAYRFLDVFQLLPAAIYAVLLPLLARVWRLGDRDRAQRILRLGVGLAAVGAVPAAVGMLLAGDRVVRLVYGSRFGPTGPMLTVLALAFVSISTGYVYAGMLLATGRVRIVGLVAVVAAVGTVAADAVVPRWGGMGAAWVTVATEYLVSTTLAVWIHRHVGPFFPVRRVAKALVAASAMVVVAIPLRGQPLAVLLLVPFLVYVVVAVRLGAVTRAELRSLVDRRAALGAA